MKKHRTRTLVARLMAGAIVAAAVVVSRPLTGCDWLLPAILFGPVVVADVLKWTLDRI